MLTPDLHDAIARHIAEGTGSAFAPGDCLPLGGAPTQRTCRLDDAHGKQAWFIKWNDAGQRSRLEAEADGLEAIARSASFRTPLCLGVISTDTHAALILEYLDLQPLRTAADGTRFAEALATLHGVTGPRFGWHRDNFCGPTPQSNAESDNWALFFARQRLHPQFEFARLAGFGNELYRDGTRLMDRVAALYLDYRPQPSLLHGDLWHGNAAVLPDGEPVVFDPACHFGDHESDLAMAELFGGFPQSFYVRYRQLRPLNVDFELRKPLYSLYHILNHLNLFGRGYLREAMRLVARLNDHLSLNGQ